MRLYYLLHNLLLFVVDKLDFTLKVKPSSRKQIYHVYYEGH